MKIGCAFITEAVMQYTPFHNELKVRFNPGISVYFTTLITLLKELLTLFSVPPTDEGSRNWEAMCFCHDIFDTIFLNFKTEGDMAGCSRLF